LGGFTGTSPITGPSKFWQGQFINFFILAVFAMSYDLLIGYTGILSFGHAAFFGGGGYVISIYYKHILPPSFLGAQGAIAIGSLDLTPAVALIAGILLVAGVTSLLGLLFSAVAVRVRGVYFAMVTLALAEALHILSKATDFAKWTGADEGLHGVPFPAWLNPNTYRLQFYFIALAFLVLMFLLLRRVVQSPTGRVMVAVRENESRVRMIGFNPALYRSVAFMVGGFVAGLAGALSAFWNLGVSPSMTGALTTIDALDHNDSGRHGHTGRSHCRCRHHAGDQPVFLYLVRRALAAGVWVDLRYDRDFPAVWNCRHLAHEAVGHKTRLPASLKPGQTGINKSGTCKQTWSFQVCLFIQCFPKSDSVFRRALHPVHLLARSRSAGRPSLARRGCLWQHGISSITGRLAHCRDRHGQDTMHDLDRLVVPLSIKKVIA
jgi:ABC-type branched-subunit amino acid transport system permease subunit